MYGSGQSYKKRENKMSASRGEKHFKNGGNNTSKRKYEHIVIVDRPPVNGVEDTKLEIPVSCRPARAARALRMLRTKYGNARLDKRIIRK